MNASPTEWTSSEEDYYIRMQGSGFVYSYEDLPTTGTVTSWQFGAYEAQPNPLVDPYNNTYNGFVKIEHTYWDFQGISVAAADLSAAIEGSSLASLMPSILAGDDTIIGSAANDFLLGFEGNDTLKGGGGNDDLAGGPGNDILNGGAGADLMRGGGGNDSYYIDNIGDRAIETIAAGGTDTARSSVSFTLGDNVENLVLTGSGAVDAWGNELNNIINGNDAANNLFGRDGDDRVDGRGGNDRVVGGIGNDTLYGGAGTDLVEGGAGRDQLYGGTAADTFVFRDGDLGTTAASADRIHDFSHAQGDRIDLHLIDANASNGAGTNEGFTFIGTSGFHNVAGELRYHEVSGYTYVYGDTDGDGIADLVIQVDGSQLFVAGDFGL